MISYDRSGPGQHIGHAPQPDKKPSKSWFPEGHVFGEGGSPIGTAKPTGRELTAYGRLRECKGKKR